MGWTSNSGALVICLAPLPSQFAIQMSQLPLLSEAKTIDLPSGDHCG